MIAPIRIKSEPAEEVLSVEQQATDQLANTANQSISIADQPTNMANREDNRSAEQGSAEQLNVLFLPCSTRTQLITSLISLSDILQSNQPIPEDARYRTCKEIEYSILLLINLPPFMPTQPSAETSGGQTLKLLRAERSNLMNHLVDIKDAVQYHQKATDELKRSLIVENERMVTQLMKLPREEPMVGDAGSAEVANGDENTGEPASNRQQVSAPNEELDRLKEQVTGLESRLLCRMNELRSELTLQIKSLDIDRPEVSFKFELAGVSKLFERIGDYRESGRFRCAGLQWSLYVSARQFVEERTLSFYLRCRHGPNDWSCWVDYELILFSKLPELKYVTKHYDIFSDTSLQGSKWFISYEELTDESNGYLEDDKILLGVEMKAR